MPDWLDVLLMFTACVLVAVSGGATATLLMGR